MPWVRLYSPPSNNPSYKVLEYGIKSVQLRDKILFFTFIDIDSRQWVCSCYFLQQYKLRHVQCLDILATEAMASTSTKPHLRIYSSSNPITQQIIEDYFWDEMEESDKVDEPDTEESDTEECSRASKKRKMS
jgi:hypothetical protein